MLSLLKGFGIVVPLSLLFARLFGMLGIWIAVPVTEALVLALGLVSLSRLSRAGNLMPARTQYQTTLRLPAFFANNTSFVSYDIW
jgi:Na+-driven multidrug efflux pump